MISRLREMRGIRLFFPLALAYGALSVPIWVLQYTGVLPPAPHFAGAAWHGHEMIYGYLAAVVAAFLTVGDRGWRVLALAAVWLAGRVILLTDAPASAAALVDGSFLPLLVVMRRPRLWAGAKLMTVGIAVVLVVLAALNLWAHVAADASRPVQTAALTVLALIVVVAGRLVPGHTRAATRRGPGLALVRTERAGIALAAMLVAAHAAAVPTLAAGAAAGLGGLQVYRLWRWWDPQILRDPLLWGLHLGLAWLVAGLLGYVAGQAGWLPAVDGLHLALVGAVGTLTLGIMMRLVRAQAGEAQRGGTAEAVVLLLVTLATLLRAGGPIVAPDLRMAATAGGGAAWNSGGRPDAGDLHAAANQKGSRAGGLTGARAEGHALVEHRHDHSGHEDGQPHPSARSQTVSFVLPHPAGWHRRAAIPMGLSPPLGLRSRQGPAEAPRTRRASSAMWAGPISQHPPIVDAPSPIQPCANSAYWAGSRSRRASSTSTVAPMWSKASLIPEKPLA